MEDKNIQSISIWSKETPTPRVKLLKKGIECLRMDGIQKNIYSSDDIHITPITYDSLVLILNADSLTKHAREQILKSDFRVYKVALEYNDSSYEEYQSGISDCTHCGHFLTKVEEDKEQGKIVISVRTAKWHQII